jgi:hypothetical protein
MNQRMTPIINADLIAAVIARSAEVGIEVPKELWNRVLQAWSK